MNTHTHPTTTDRRATAYKFACSCTTSEKLIKARKAPPVVTRVVILQEILYS